jgi:hypothetical protein
VDCQSRPEILRLWYPDGLAYRWGAAVMNRSRKKRDGFIVDTLKTIEQIPPAIEWEGEHGSST